MTATLIRAKPAYFPVVDKDDPDAPPRFVRRGIRLEFTGGVIVNYTPPRPKTEKRESLPATVSVSYPGTNVYYRSGTLVRDQAGRPVQTERSRNAPLPLSQFVREYSPAFVVSVLQGLESVED